MAIKHVCDGCGDAIEDAPNMVGHVIQRDYCDKCADIAREYLIKIDQVHDEVATKFKDHVRDVRLKYSGLLTELPDYRPKEPDEEA